MKREILFKLLNIQEPLESLKLQLSQLPWDSTEVVELEKSHVLNALKACLQGSFSADDIECWANMLEARDDISFEKASEIDLRQFIFEAANPILEGSLDTAWIQFWIKKLSNQENQ